MFYISAMLPTVKCLLNRYMEFKDTYTEKAPPNKIPALTKSMNMGNWVVGALNQLSIRDS